MTQTILTIDDEPPITRWVEMSLSPAGYQCFAAYNVQQALEILSKIKVDLILLDLILPDVNGYSFFDLLKERGIDIPVIVVSGCMSSDALDLAWELGAQDYIIKPFKPTELLFRVRNTLKLHSVVSS